VSLENVISKRDDSNYCGGWGVQGKMGESFDEGCQQSGREMSTVGVIIISFLRQDEKLWLHGRRAQTHIHHPEESRAMFQMENVPIQEGIKLCVKRWIVP